MRALFICLALCASLYSAAAYAYLDPGSGSVLLQVILGGLAGLAVAGKLFWHRILEFLRIRKPLPDESNPHESD